MGNFVRRSPNACPPSAYRCISARQGAADELRSPSAHTTQSATMNGVTDFFLPRSLTRWAAPCGLSTLDSKIRQTPGMTR